jgi:hypothetical protein
MAMLVNYDTNEKIEGAAARELADAACESETPVLALWSDLTERWELIDESQVATLRQCRPEPPIVAMYGLP